jgi:hypothetical protein
MIDPIIDRSPEQKRMRVEQLRKELFDMGFSVVPTEWMREQFWKNKVAKAMEAAE